MINVYVTIQDKRYYRLGGVSRFCKQVVQNAWISRKPVEISVLLADNKTVQELNLKYRQINRPTNVLSFESGFCPTGKKDVWAAGDIVTAYQVLLAESKERKITFDAHLAHLLTHGALHLQGYDHQTSEDAEKMEALEIKMLKQIGYDNPYKDETE